MGVAAAFILPFQAVGYPITALPCIDAAPWRGAGELPCWAAAGTGDCRGWLRACDGGKVRRNESEGPGSNSTLQLALAASLDPHYTEKDN